MRVPVLSIRPRIAQGYLVTASGILVHKSSPAPLDWDKIWLRLVGSPKRNADGTVEPLFQFAIDRFEDFRLQSRLRDGYAGHEILNSKWLEVHKYGMRLHTAASKNNPALAVDHATHVAIGQYQKELGIWYGTDLKKLSAREVINRNAIALRKAGVPEDVIAELKSLAIKHGKAIGAICP